MNNTAFSLLSNPLHLIWYPGCDEDDSIEEMMIRMHATKDFIQGKLHPDDYLDLLDSQDFGVHELLDNWESLCSQ